MFNFQHFRLDTSFLSICHQRGKRSKLFSFSSKWFGNLKKDVKDKRLINSVKYHYYLQDSVKLVKKKLEKKCQNNHKVKINLSKIQTCATYFASYSLTQ